MKRIACFTIAIIMALGIVCGLAAVASAAVRATITANGKLYKNANSSTTVVCSVEKDDEVSVIAETTKSGVTWYKVTTADGETGYIKASSVKLSSEKTAYVSTNTMKVYASKSASSKLVATLNKDEEVTLLARYKSGWARVSFDGKTGYCNYNSLTLTAPEKDGDSLEDIMEAILADVDNLPMCGLVELNEDNFSSFAFIDYKSGYEGLASEAMIGSIAHSVVLVKVPSNASSVANSIKKNADPRKWICVEAESVQVVTKDDVILLVMSSEERADQIVDNFKNLK